MWLIDMVAKLFTQKAGPDSYFFLTTQLIRGFLH
jgi:hypothetical protein